MSTEAAERFQAAQWLEGAEESLRHVIFTHLSEDHVPEGTLVVEQGQSNDHLSFVIDGRFSVWRHYPDNRRDPVALSFEAPAIFGETSFYATGPSLVTVQAETPLWRLTMDHEAHERLRAEHPRAAEALAFASAKILSRQFARLESRFEQWTLAPTPSPRSKRSELSQFRDRLFATAGA